MSPVVYRLVRTTPSRAALPLCRLVVLAAPRAPMSSAVHRLVRSLPPVAHYVDLAQFGQLSSKTSAERLPVAQHVVVDQDALCLER
jgi:hypothetical protein